MSTWKHLLNKMMNFIRIMTSFCITHHRQEKFALVTVLLAVLNITLSNTQDMKRICSSGKIIPSYLREACDKLHVGGVGRSGKGTTAADVAAEDRGVGAETSDGDVQTSDTLQFPSAQTGKLL